MSHKTDPVSIVRHNMEVFNAGDFDAALEFIAEDWTYIPGPYWTDPGTRYHGHEGYRSMLAHTGVRDSEFEMKVEVRQVDQYVLAAGSAWIDSPQVRRGSHPFATLHVVADRKIRLSMGFADEQQALEAVGLGVERELRPAVGAPPEAAALLDSDAGSAVLNPREREVISLLAAGLSEPQIAERLFLPAATVRANVHNALRALGAGTQPQAVVEALIRGEIELRLPGLEPAEEPTED
jgi:DNA-binding CsgD family transcriptional regulator/ketosteroid isomerase-like protein